MTGDRFVRAHVIAPTIARVYAHVVFKYAVFKSRAGFVSRRPDLKALLTIPDYVASEGHIYPSARDLVALHSYCNVVYSEKAAPPKLVMYDTPFVVPATLFNPTVGQLLQTGLKPQ